VRRSTVHETRVTGTHHRLQIPRRFRQTLHHHSAIALQMLKRILPQGHGFVPAARPAAAIRNRQVTARPDPIADGFDVDAGKSSRSTLTYLWTDRDARPDRSAIAARPPMSFATAPRHPVAASPIRHRWPRLALLLFALVGLAAAACGSGTSPPNAPPASRTLADGSLAPPAPPVPDGPLNDDLIADLDRAFLGDGLGIDTTGAFFRIGAAQDPRVAWLLADLMRFFPDPPTASAVVQAFEQLTDTHVPPGINWITMTNWLFAWDTPAPPGYVNWKRIPFERVEPAWAPFFDDQDADIDWRLITWGGVRIDDRPLSQVHVPCSRCIPALDDPALTDASGGAWYADAGLVFGLSVNGEARAYPKHIMEVHEMVNDTLGGRRIGIPYCTLCGSAQAYYTDQVPPGFETIELRTSGLLSRSNKVMFDFHTSSVFDTFRGVALSGPLQDQRYALEMLSVVTSTWGEWKAAYPDTTIVAQDGGIGASYPLNPLFGRDDNGPIFPIGGVDQRLPAQEPILGIETPDGQALAFPVAEARDALERGATVMLNGVHLMMAAGGLSAALADGTPIVTHQAFWFAWSQFHPQTARWSPSP